jgi:SulP family sulfate permease
MTNAGPAANLSELSPRWQTLFRLVPALDSLRTYSPTEFRRDVLAGLTVAALAVPQAMAYALVAGIDPKYGLYTAIVMTAVGALFDSSKQLINGPTNAISIALLSALAVLPSHDRVSAAILLALMIGVIQTGITLLRLGDVTRYVSHAVIVGFTVGASVLLALDQLKNLLGLKAPRGEAEHFLVQFVRTLADGVIHPLTLSVGVSTIVLLLGLRALNRRLRVFIPELLVAMIFMAFLTWLLDLEGQGVRTVGDIPRALPEFQLPAVDWDHVRQLSSSAVAIAVLGLLEAIAMAKAIATRTGQKLDINQQCLSEGVANITGSFFQCMPGSGSLTRSAVNQQSGAMTQWSGVFSAAAVAAIVLLFAPLARYIPRAALAGILMMTAWHMVDKAQLRYYVRATRFDALIVFITAVAAVAISVEFCILIGTLLSFILYVPKAARLYLTELTLTPERVIRERQPADPPCNRVLLFDLEGELFFGAGPDLDRHLAEIAERTRTGVRLVVLRLKHVRNPDAVCLSHIGDFLERMAEQKVQVLLCGVRTELWEVLWRSGLEQLLGPRHIFREEEGVTSSTLEAVRYAYDLLGQDLCETCPRRDEGNGREPLYYMI